MLRTVRKPSVLAEHRAHESGIAFHCAIQAFCNNCVSWSAVKTYPLCWNVSFNSAGLGPLQISSLTHPSTSLEMTPSLGALEESGLVRKRKLEEARCGSFPGRRQRRPNGVCCSICEEMLALNSSSTHDKIGLLKAVHGDRPEAGQAVCSVFSVCDRRTQTSNVPHRDDESCEQSPRDAVTNNSWVPSQVGGRLVTTSPRNGGRVFWSRASTTGDGGELRTLACIMHLYCFQCSYWWQHLRARMFPIKKLSWIVEVTPSQLSTFPTQKYRLKKLN